MAHARLVSASVGGWGLISSIEEERASGRCGDERC